MNIQKGPQDVDQVVGELPVSAGATIPLASMHIKLEGENAAFIQKWQEILSTLESSVQQTGTVLPVPVSKAEKIGSATSSNDAVAPQSTGESDSRRTFTDRSNSVGFEIPASRGLSERIIVQKAVTSGSVACSNRCGDIHGEGRISTKPSHLQSIGETKVSRPRQVPDADVTNPLAASESIVLPVNPLTVALQPDYSAVWTGTTERPLQSTPAHGSGESSVRSSDSMAEEETLNWQTRAKGDPPAEGDVDSSMRRSPTVVMHRSIQAADAASLPIETELPTANDLDIREGPAWHRGISSSNSLPENPMDNVSSARAAEDVISASIPRVQDSKASPAHPTSDTIHDGIQTTRTIRDSFSIAANSVNAKGIKPASISSHEESGAPVYAYPGPTQTSLPRSNESISRFERQNQALNAIDEHAPISRWTLAGSHRAEAGFHDPSLGWVSVRAQAGAGGIHAVVVPASDTAAQVLNTHLAGLNAHMTSQYEHLSTVTLASPDARSGDWDATGQSTQHDHPDSNQKEAQQDREHPQSAQPVSPQRTTLSAGRMGMESVEIPASIFAHRSGESHVSVIA